MEDSVILTNRILVNQVQTELVGKVIKRKILTKINKKNLFENGEICFPANLLAWKDFIQPIPNHENCSNILEYYFHRRNYNPENLSKRDILQKAQESLILASKSWPITIEKCSIREDRISLFLKRTAIIESTIKNALKYNVDYGRRTFTDKTISLRINEDDDSNLTTARLKLIKEVSHRVLELKGYKIIDKDAQIRYLLTTKSQGCAEDDYRRCICGVVKNQDSNTKEIHLDWSTYINEKIEELKNSIEIENESCRKENDRRNIAEAIAKFELLSVKPCRPVFVGTNKNPEKTISSSKGGSFVLYNTARISAILQKFEEDTCLGRYPSLPDIDKVDFSQLNQEEEWDLVYNFILGYPEMIEDCIVMEESLEISLQMICLFLSRLSKNFSVYYRKTRILTEGRPHLIPTMMARLYLLRALQIVVNNSLSILNILPVNHM